MADHGCLSNFLMVSWFLLVENCLFFAMKIPGFRTLISHCPVCCDISGLEKKPSGKKTELRLDAIFLGEQLWRRMFVEVGQKNGNNMFF